MFIESNCQNERLDNMSTMWIQNYINTTRRKKIRCYKKNHKKSKVQSTWHLVPSLSCSSSKRDWQHRPGTDVATCDIYFLLVKRPTDTKTTTHAGDEYFRTHSQLNPVCKTATHVCRFAYVCELFHIEHLQSDSRNGFMKSVEGVRRHGCVCIQVSFDKSPQITFVCQNHWDESGTNPFTSVFWHFN